MHVYGARGPLSDTPQLGEYEVVLAHEANAAITKVTAVAMEQILGADDDLDQAIKEAYLLGERDMLATVQAFLNETRAAYRDESSMDGGYGSGAIDALLVVSEALDYDERFTNGQEKP